jgi:hypothetical protein
MTDTLQTVVGNIITRLLLLEPLAVPDASFATKRWVYFNQGAPYWTNRIAALLAPSGPEQLPEYTLVVQMRLVLSYESNIVREDAVSGNAQEKAWEYIPAALRYFEINRDLSPSGYAQLTHIVSPRVSITNTRGLDLQVLPMSRDILLATDFELTIPIRVGNDEE